MSATNTSMSKPKILNLSATTVKNQRKLIWLQKQDPTVNWSKWDAVVSSIDNFKYWSQQRAKIVGIIITKAPSNEINSFIDELFTVSKQVPMMLLSQDVLSLKSQEFWSDNFDNILNLNDILDQYPFIHEAWIGSAVDGSVGDAIAIMGMICRYNCIIDAQIATPREMSMAINNVKVELNKKPNEVWLVTQFFKHKDSGRYREIKECLAKNCVNEHIDKIVLINEKDYTSEYYKMPGSKKIQQFVTGRRLTYANFIQFVYDAVPENVFVILANADIYFKESLAELHKITMEDRMLGLLRWDDDGRGKSTIFGPRSDSQDCWIFLSNSIKTRKWDYGMINFELGQPGCDNAFAGQILRNKFVLSNPALSFKSYHLHNTNIRNYSRERDTIRSDIYVNIEPTHIIDIKQEQVPSYSKPTMLSNEMVEFQVKSSSMSNEITYCTMLEKEGRYKWEPSVENYYFQAQLPVYSWKNACVTGNGLVYDYNGIYKGKYADSDDKWNYWAKTEVDIFKMMQRCDKMLAIPFKDCAVFKNPDTYILNYVSRCARLLKEHPGASIWAPVECRDYLEYFEWDSEVKGMYFDDKAVCYADEVVGYLPGPESSELGAEDITALRSILPSWIEKPIDEKVCAVVIGGEMTVDFVEKRVAEFLQGKSEEWSVRYVYDSEYASYDSLIGASLCIFIGGKRMESRWAKLWALPKGCRVIEFQQELQISGEFQHLAHISGFESWVLLLSKGSVEDVQEQVMEQMEKWWRKNGLF